MEIFQFPDAPGVTNIGAGAILSPLFERNSFLVLASAHPDFAFANEAGTVLAFLHTFTEQLLSTHKIFRLQAG